MLAGLGAGLATLVLLAAVLLGGGWLAAKAPGPSAAKGRETVVILRRGAGLAEIAGALKRAGVIRSDLLFIATAQFGGRRQLKAGEYAFASRASLARVLAKVRAGDVVHHRITVPEGITAEQVVAILNGSPILTGSVSVPPEGSVLPDTYDVARGESRARVLERMIAARDRFVAQLWSRKRPGLPYTSAQQVSTLASLVERETSVAAERPRVAAVYLNRLRDGMRLGADPTVIYGITRAGPLGRPLSLKDLQTNTPYNTYLNPGLPPTPIGNPGRASLAAVMDPAQTQELYFVADGTGGHVFASTLDQHNKNVAAWRRIEHTRATTATKVTTDAPTSPASEHR